MPVTISILRPIAPPTTTPVRKLALRQHDHDLPVLAAEQHDTPRPPWDKLLAAGIQPALILGAERRLQGKR